MIKKIFIILIPIALVMILFSLQGKSSLVNPLAKSTPKPKPLLVYTFDNLKNTKFSPVQITLGSQIGETENSLSQMFYFQVSPTPNNIITKKVSGVINLPKKAGNYPVIVMFRGFVAKENYQPGIGTNHSAESFANHGFITVAPDFLGFGESDSSTDGFEDRFQTYTTALTLLSSISNLNNSLEASYSGKITADTSKINIWGHSNGGQIAISVLAISGVAYPTVLWAPVSKSFPYSILYYTDEFDDQGKSLRQALAYFEKDYDTEDFSPARFYSRIKAPLEIHQGNADQEVPFWWSDELVENFKKAEIDVKYLKYPGADHNFLPNSWSEAILESINFFKEHFHE